MELLQLTYFLACARTEHLTKTAQELYITPSTLSVSISRLEKELGVPLFDRVGRNMRLNEYGRFFYSRVSESMDILNDAKAELEEMTNKSRNKVTIALTSALLWENALQSYRTQHPDVFINILPVSQNFVPTETLDLFIQSSQNACPKDWTYADLMEDYVLLAVPPDHRLAANERTVSLKDAADEYFIASLGDSPFRWFTDELCRTAGFEPKYKLECDYMMRPRLCLSERMLCVTTGLGARAGLFGQAKLLRIVDPPCSRPQAIYWRKSRYISPAVAALRDHMIAFYKEYDPDDYLKK